MFESSEPTAPTDSDAIKQMEQNTTPASPGASHRMPAPPPIQRPSGSSPTSLSSVAPLADENQQPDAPPTPLPSGLLAHRWRRSPVNANTNQPTTQVLAAREPFHPRSSPLPDGMPSPVPLENGTQTTTLRDAGNTSRPDARPTYLGMSRRAGSPPGRWLLLTGGLSLLVLVSLLVLASSHLAVLDQLSKQVQSDFSRSPQTSTRPEPTATPTSLPFFALDYSFKYPSSWTAGCDSDTLQHCEATGYVTSPAASSPQVATFSVSVPQQYEISDLATLDDFLSADLHASGATHTQDTVAFAGTQWLRQEVSYFDGDQPIHVVGLLGHHHNQFYDETYVLMYSVNQGAWPQVVVQDFALILSSFHFEG